MPRHRTGVSINCIVCNKEVYKFPNKVKRGWTHYCSKECTAKGNVGKLHPSWKGGSFVNQAGYRMVRYNNKYQYEHRVVMERYLGRALKFSEAVHHKDSNKLNNDIDNLELLDRSAHQKYHLANIHSRNCWVCKEEGIVKPHYCRGFCQNHYEKYKRLAKRHHWW